jgi:hypothetical protein
MSDLPGSTTLAVGAGQGLGAWERDAEAEGLAPQV